MPKPPKPSFLHKYTIMSRQESNGRATRARQVAEREASRLARPDKPPVGSVVHSKRGSRLSTPFGSLQSPDTSGATQEEWCGPFSVARQMIAAREEARRLREEQQAAIDPDNKASHPLDYLHEQALLEKKRKENPSMNWVGDNNSKDDSASANYYVKRRSRVSKMRTGSGGKSCVPSLFHLCVDYIAKNFEHVETLGAVGHPVRRALCERLVELGEMNGAAFDVLAEKGVDTIELIDCAQVSEDQFCDALKICLPAGLKAIFLKHCGRCFGNQAAKILIDTKDIQLFALSLSGAYILKDSCAADLISATARTLSSIDLTACPLIGAKFCQSIADCYRIEGNCLLELALQNVQISKEALLSLGSESLRQLKSLKLKEIDSVDDEVVSILTKSIDGGSLENVDLSGNPQLTDDILSSIRRCNTDGNLRALQLSGLTNLTAIGLEAFFTSIDSLPAPPMLRKLDLSELASVNDSVVTLAAKAASFKRSVAETPMETLEVDDPNPELMGHKLAPMKGLVHINIAGSSITDKSLEVLASTCSSSLMELDVSFCTAISDKGLGYLVSKVGEQFTKLNVWGLAQLSDEFYDGHSSKSLEIMGVWMKISGGRSLR